MGHAKKMSTIMVELTIKVKNQIHSSQCRKDQMDSSHSKPEIFTPPFEMNSITAIYSHLCYVSICNPARLRQIDPAKACPENTRL